jgi:hypothetical protein
MTDLIIGIVIAFWFWLAWKYPIQWLKDNWHRTPLGEIVTKGKKP